MDTGQAVKQKTYQALGELPPEGFEELFHFVEFLKFKYGVQHQTHKVIALGGLWSDVAFDVTDAEVRALRQQVTTHLMHKV